MRDAFWSVRQGTPITREEMRPGDRVRRHFTSEYEVNEHGVWRLVVGHDAETWELLERPEPVYVKGAIYQTKDPVATYLYWPRSSAVAAADKTPWLGVLSGARCATSDVARCGLTRLDAQE